MALTMRNWFLTSEFVHSSCQASVTDGFWLGRLDHTGCRDVNRALGGWNMSCYRGRFGFARIFSTMLAVASSRWR